MSQTAENRVVPMMFEDYVAKFFQPLSAPGETCSGCLEHPAIAKDTGNRYCEVCLRYSHGYDQAEEKLVRSLVQGAIAAALDAGASGELVRRAVLAAVEQAGVTQADPVVLRAA